MAAPFLLPLAISGGLAGAEAISSMVPTAADRRNKQKLDELLELERKRQLGLTGQEQRVAEARTEMPLAQQTSAQMAAQNRALAAGGANVGAALAAGQQMADTGALARQKAISDIEALDLQKKQAQLQEIEQRTAIRAQRNMEQRQAMLGALGDVAQAGLAAESQRLTTQGPKVPKMTEDEQLLFDFLTKNPDMYNEIKKKYEGGQ